MFEARGDAFDEGFSQIPNVPLADSEDGTSLDFSDQFKIGLTDFELRLRGVRYNSASNHDKLEY